MFVISSCGSVVLCPDDVHSILYFDKIVLFIPYCSIYKSFCHNSVIYNINWRNCKTACSDIVITRCPMFLFVPIFPIY